MMKMRPAELSQLKDITINPWFQSKMLDVQKEVSRLQLSLARISEGMTTPAAPFTGVVQRVLLRLERLSILARLWQCFLKHMMIQLRLLHMWAETLLKDFNNRTSQHNY